MICQSMSHQVNLLQALGGMTLGSHTLNHHRVYIAIVRSMHDYAAAAWHPGCQLPPPANLREYSYGRPEPSLAWSAVPKLKQSLRNPSYPLFQRVSKPFSS